MKHRHLHGAPAAERANRKRFRCAALDALADSKLRADLRTTVYDERG
jgi:hypothetical protein